ncbi:uncharacterized protein LOC116169109 [Photinus pyralis]|uniref:uncharacterized protein LOC116169109 n=1 Tax=Photinus pyralis TaxID=7054 RepID=UPI0012674FB1|nr:uncharacterized protein LOC116169109 [Photinus pyralis]
MEKRFPTIAELYQRLKDECPDFPQVCSTTVKKWVKDINFIYRKLENRPILMEVNAIAAKRAEYLYAIKRYRETGWNLFFTDETWCGANHSKKFGWVEYITPENRDSFNQYRGTIQEINGYRGGIKRPSGAGQRIIILDIGNENGFLPGCSKCFIGKKGSADYHDEMNKQHFEEWLRYVLGVMPDKSVIVLDQAPYRTMLNPEFRNPTTAWRKADIIEWLNKRKVQVPEHFDTFDQMTRPSLLQLSRMYNYKKQYFLEKVVNDVRQDKVKRLWLPVAHCEFNPIELIWAYVKNKVAKLNTTFKIKDVLDLCKATLEDVPKSVWANCVHHAKKVEDMYREKENLIDVAIEPLVINLNDEDSDDAVIDFDEDDLEEHSDNDDNECI